MVECHLIFVTTDLSGIDDACRYAMPTRSVQKVFTNAVHVTTAAPRLVAPGVNRLCTIYTISTRLQRPQRRSHDSYKHPCSRYHEQASGAFLLATSEVDAVR